MSEASSTTTPANNAEPEPSTSIYGQGDWTRAILLAGLIAWLGYSFPPVTWRIPDSMSSIGALSPQSEQDALAAVVLANLWKNTLLKFGLAGAGLGLCGMLLSARKLTQSWSLAVITFVSGIAGGLLAGTAGLFVHRYLALGHPFPLVSEATRPLVCEIILLAAVSILLILPFSILLFSQPVKSERQKALTVPLAAILTGLLVPFLGAVVLPAGTNSATYPPVGMLLTLLWFAALAGLTVLLVVYMGSREAKSTVAES